MSADAERAYTPPVQRSVPVQPSSPPSWLAEVLAPHEGSGSTPYTWPDGIVRAVEDEGYVASFGREWTWFDRTQLDRPAGGGESERAFFAKTGIPPEDLAGARVLDAGCGMGRFADVAHRAGAEVVAVDLSEAVRSARRNLAPEVAVLQADLRALPLRRRSFDVVYSLGVLHHTPDAREAFEAIAELVRPGGTLAVWVYSSEPPTGRAHRVSDALRHLTSRLPHRLLLRLCRIAVPLGRLYRRPRGARLYPLLPVSVHPDPEWRVLDTFDWYSPRYQSKHRWAEVERWFAAIGFIDVRRQAAEVAVSGRRPAEA